MVKSLVVPAFRINTILCVTVLKVLLGFSIAPYKAFFSTKTVFFLFLHENICCGTHEKRLAEVLLINTHNICFHGEIRENYFPCTHSHLELRGSDLSETFHMALRALLFKSNDVASSTYC